MYNTDSKLTLKGYPLHHRQPNKKEHVFDVVIGHNENITISTFKDLVNVKINGGTAHHFKDSVGLMGSFAGVMLARDGATVIEDPNAFGQEWQVHDDEPMLFNTVRAPQYPTGNCILPSPGAKNYRQRQQNNSRRRQSSKASNTLKKKGAQKACAHLFGPAKGACIFDVMAVGDVDIAKAEASAYN